MNVETIERTPEQLAAIEARKVRLAEAREAEALAKARSARRRALDTNATAQMLLKKGLVSQDWIDRKTPEQLRRYVRVACIAYQVDAISMTGVAIPVINLMQRRR